MILIKHFQLCFQQNKKSQEIQFLPKIKNMMRVQLILHLRYIILTFHKICLE